MKEEFKCKHDWKKGTIIFDGRVNIMTNEVELAEQCDKCGRIRWKKNLI